MQDRDVDMYGISRIDAESQNCYSWRVSLRRRGKRIVKNFPDRRYGGKEVSLLAAAEFRDAICKAHPPITRKEFASARRRHNRTGITGVYRYAKRYKLKCGTVREIWYWEANWPKETGRSAKATFSVNTYGEDIARLLAIRAREEGMQSVEGVFWASERGSREERDDISADTEERAGDDPFSRVA